MPTFTLRFYGRFVFAEHRWKQGTGDLAAGALDVLAVDMSHNPDVRSDRHRFMLTAARADVESAGTRPADGVFLSSAAPAQAEHMYWHLDDHAVNVAGDGTFSWTNPSTGSNPVEVPSLRELAGADAMLASLPPTSGMVSLSEGTTRLTQVVDTQHEFVRVGAPNTPEVGPRRLADVVEISIERPLLVITTRPPGGPESAIVLRSLSGAPVVATFSNLCAAAHGDVDVEYAGLYEVLARPPLVRDRLVPRRAPGLGVEFDCWKNATIPRYV